MCLFEYFYWPTELYPFAFERWRELRVILDIAEKQYRRLQRERRTNEIRPLHRHGEQSMYRATVLNNTNNIAFSMHYSTQSDAVSLDLVPFVGDDLVER